MWKVPLDHHKQEMSVNVTLYPQETNILYTSGYKDGHKDWQTGWLQYTPESICFARI